MLALGLALSLWQFERASRARDDAERQAAIATATNRFLNEDLLGAGIGGDSPAWYERNPRLGDILDAAAERLDQRYTRAPLLAATLHQTLGRAYRSTGAYRKAAAQLTAADDLLRRYAGVTDERSLLADYELATMLARLSRFADAAALLDRADAAAGASLHAISEINLRSRVARGDLLYQQMKVQPALAAYRAAAALQPIVRPNDPVSSANLLLNIAGCELRLARAAEAERIARRILAGTPYTEARIGIAMLALARSRLGDALRAQGRFAEAIPITAQAVADYGKAQGADGQGTLTALSSLSYLYSLNGDPARALGVQRDVYQRTLGRWGEHNQYTLVELMNLGSDEYDSGDLRAALRDLEAADRGLSALSGERSPTVQAARVAEANVLNDLGRRAEALTLIDRVDPEAYQATTSDPGRAPMLAAMRAQILLGLQRRDEALPALRQAVRQMHADGVPAAEIEPYRKMLDGAAVAAR